ncbi:MAG: hypothetical protein ACI8TE_001707 [Francisella sp.]|jgi:hypothetical protein
MLIVMAMVDLIVADAMIVMTAVVIALKDLTIDQKEEQEQLLIFR